MSQKCQNFWQNWQNKNLAGAKKFSARKKFGERPKNFCAENFSFLFAHKNFLSGKKDFCGHFSKGVVREVKIFRAEILTFFCWFTHKTSKFYCQFFGLKRKNFYYWFKAKVKKCLKNAKIFGKIGKIKIWLGLKDFPRKNFDLFLLIYT